VPFVGNNDSPMRVESRDSLSLKPAELDELGQLLGMVGMPIPDEVLDAQIEQFPLVALTAADGDLHGFLFGSLERIGGTPCILWGVGGVRKSKQSGPVLKGLVGELYRRAAISFPDEDVLVAGRVAHPASYALFGVLRDVCPRPNYSPTGEERAWGRRLARRFRCDGTYDERAFRVNAKGSTVPVLDARTVSGGGKRATEMVAKAVPEKGEAVIVFGWAMAEALADGLGHR